MGLHSIEKKQLSARGILAKIRSVFSKIPEPIKDTRGLKELTQRVIQAYLNGSRA
jgi:hypothetical protein